MKSLVLASLTVCSVTVGCSPDDRNPGALPDGPAASSVNEHWLDSPTVGALATDDERLYYVDGPSLKSISLDGGTPTTLFTLPPPPSTTAFGGIRSITIGATDVAIVDEVYATTGETVLTLRLVAKAGGSATTLATSMDSRAFLGVSFDGDHVLYSSSTAVLRVARTGGQPEFVGQSDQSVQYWIFSPMASGDQIFWAADHAIYRMARTDPDKRAQPMASLPGQSGMIIASDGAFVVALSAEIDFQQAASSFVEVDPTSGVVTQPIALGDDVTQVAASDADVWASTFTGLVRVSRSDGARTQVTTSGGMYVSTNHDAVFATGGTGITRVSLR